MKVILLKDISGVGRKHDVKDVSDGHARNFLFPRGFAQEASASRLRQVESLRKTSEEGRRVQKELLLKNLEALKGVRISLSGKANEQGHLFKGIHKEEIVTALHTEARVELLPEHLLLEHPIKAVGEHVVSVAADGKQSSFVLVVTAA